MAKHGKKYEQAAKLIDRNKRYPVDEACALIGKTATKKFDETLSGYKDKLACYTVSLDMPFAQKRFCSAENISTMQTLSDVHNHSFGQNYGVLIEGLPIPLLSRSIFVVDKNGKLTYVEYVPEVTSHPNYDKALEALKAAAS